MPDPYANIADTDTQFQEMLADVLEQRAADPEMKEIAASYLAELPLPGGSKVVEVGCGTGAVTRTIARLGNVAKAVGVDPSPIFVAKARELSSEMANVSYEEADGRALPFPDGSFDAVVIQTVLIHAPGPEKLLAEARRVLRPGGSLAVLEPDVISSSVALGPHDPLQCCISFFLENMVHDPWLVQRLPRLVGEAGFELLSFRGHGYVSTDSEYMAGVATRGADFMAKHNLLGLDAAEGLKSEARRRLDAGTFFGSFPLASLIARKSS